MLVNIMIEVLEFESVTRESFGVAALKDTEFRPWAEHEDDLEVYCIPERYMFHPTPSNTFVLKNRPSISDLIRKKLPDEHKNRNMEEVIFDALKTFKSPYGPVGEIHSKSVYDRCECIDPATGFHDFHPTCCQPSVVVAKILFTQEEAERKAKEDEESADLYAYAYEEVDDFLFSKEGKKALKVEVKLRKKFNKRDIRKKKKRLKELKKEHSAAKIALKNVKERKRQFEKGAAIAFHRFKNKGEAIVAENEAIQGVQDAYESTLRLKEDLALSYQQKKKNMQAWMSAASVDLSEAVGEKLTKKVQYLI
jgi:hypothetical protein